MIPPSELCVLCRKPILQGQEPSSWNGQPAHGDCVRVHMLQKHPVFREWGEESPGEGPGNEEDGFTRSDDDEDEGF